MLSALRCIYTLYTDRRPDYGFVFAARYKLHPGSPGWLLPLSQCMSIPPQGVKKHTHTHTQPPLISPSVNLKPAMYVFFFFSPFVFYNSEHQKKGGNIPGPMMVSKVLKICTWEAHFTCPT